MFKSVFAKYYTVVSAIVVSSFLVMTAMQILLFTRSVAEEKQTLLVDNAISIAHHTATAETDTVLTDSSGTVYQMDKTSLTPFLRMMSEALDATILLTDAEGKVLLCSDGAQSTYIGNNTLSTLVPQVENGFFTIGTLNGLFFTRRYTAAAPVTIKGSTIGYVFISAPATTAFQTLRTNWQVYLLSTMSTLLVAFIVTYGLTYRIVRPLRQMAAATRRFARGDFNTRLSVVGQDEVAELADSLNHMADSLSSLESMQRNFIASVSHELKTPMTTISGFVDGILDGTVPPERQRHYLKIVSDEVKRLSRLVRSMLDLSRIDAGELKLNRLPVNLTEVVGGVLISSEQRIEQKELRITGLEDCGDCPVLGDHDLLSQVIYNLVDNAIKFTNENGEIDIRMSREGGKVFCVVRNTGAGIPAEEMPQIFERFYKSDRSRSLDKNGMGLGLYIVKTVINLHQGEITVRSVAGEFTEFAFWLPEAGGEPAGKAGGNVQ